MKKSLALMSAALVAGAAFLGAGSQADARSCQRCGPVKPVHTYSTVNKVMHQTRYRDVTRTRYVQREQRITHVTRVRPVVYVHNVTRVHHRTVAVVRPVHMHAVQYMAPRHVYTNSVVNTYDCGCR